MGRGPSGHRQRRTGDPSLSHWPPDAPRKVHLTDGGDQRGYGPQATLPGLPQNEMERKTSWFSDGDPQQSLSPQTPVWREPLSSPPVGPAPTAGLREPVPVFCPRGRSLLGQRHARHRHRKRRTSLGGKNEENP